MRARTCFLGKVKFTLHKFVLDYNLCAVGGGVGEGEGLESCGVGEGEGDGGDVNRRLAKEACGVLDGGGELPCFGFHVGEIGGVKGEGFDVDGGEVDVFCVTACDLAVGDDQLTLVGGVEAVGNLPFFKGRAALYAVLHDGVFTQLHHGVVILQGFAVQSRGQVNDHIRVVFLHQFV